MAKIINTNKVKEKYIYFVQQGLNGNIKIGYSSDLDSRIKALQTASPEKLRLLHKIPVESQEEETRIHNMFKDKQKTGEWFEYCSEIISFIEQDKLEREEKKWNLVAQHIQEQESKIRQLEESLLESNNNYDFGFSIHSITDIYLSVEEPRVISGITCFGETFGKGRPAYMKDHCYVELDNIESLGLMAYLREENPEDSFDLYEWVSFQRSEKLESASERRKALAKSLEDLPSNPRIKIIEKNDERAQYVANELNEAMVIKGDGLDENILKEVNLEEIDTVLCITDDDEVNLMSALLCKKKGIKRVIAIANSHNYSLLQSSLKIDDIVDPRMTTVSTILKHVHKGKIDSVFTLDDGEYEIIEAKILENSELVNKTIEKSSLPEGIKIGLIARDKNIIVPNKKFEFKLNDRVILLSSRSQLKKVEQLFRISEYY